MTDMTDAELLNAALSLMEELLRRNMLGLVISVPASAVKPQKIAQDWPGPEDCPVMDDHLLLFAGYDWDETIDDPRTRKAAILRAGYRPFHAEEDQSDFHGGHKARLAGLDFRRRQFEHGAWP